MCTPFHLYNVEAGSGRFPLRSRLRRRPGSSRRFPFRSTPFRRGSPEPSTRDSRGPQVGSGSTSPSPDFGPQGALDPRALRPSRVYPRLREAGRHPALPHNSLFGPVSCGFEASELVQNCASGWSHGFHLNSSSQTCLHGCGSSSGRGCTIPSVHSSYSSSSGSTTGS